MASRGGTKSVPIWRETMKRGAVRSGALAGACALGLLALLLVLALASYRPSDPSMMTAAAGPARNLVGGIGASRSTLRSPRRERGRSDPSLPGVKSTSSGALPRGSGGKLFGRRHADTNDTR